MGSREPRLVQWAGARADKKKYGAGAVKPYLVGARAGVGKNPLKTAHGSWYLIRAGAV